MSGKLFKTIAAGGSATKEFYVPCTYGSVDYDTSWGCYPVWELLANGNYAHTSFRVPHDFNSIVVASIMVIPRCTQASANWDIYSNYAQTGEGYQAHSESDTVSTYNVTENQIFEVNIAGILTNLSANDMVGIKIVLSTHDHDVFVLGVRFKYL